MHLSLTSSFYFFNKKLALKHEMLLEFRKLFFKMLKHVCLIKRGAKSTSQRFKSVLIIYMNVFVFKTLYVLVLRNGSQNENPPTSYPSRKPSPFPFPLYNKAKLLPQNHTLILFTKITIKTLWRKILKRIGRI